MKTQFIKHTILGLMLGLPATQAAANCQFDRMCMRDPVCSAQCAASLNTAPAAEAAKCDKAPAVTVSSFPTKLAPKGNPDKTVLIEIAGDIKAGDACTLTDAWYEVDDEYKVMNGKKAIEVGSDGKFTAKIKLEASRKGKDVDGRDYRFTVFGKNEAGVGKSTTFKATVAHDNRSDKAKK